MTFANNVCGLHREEQGDGSTEKCRLVDEHKGTIICD